jgi:hypothetical protein
MLGVAIALLAGHTVAEGNPYTPEGCTGTVVNVKGVITSRPANPNDPTELQACSVVAGTGDDAPQDPLVCLRVDVSGSVKASGYSVLTSVPLSDGMSFLNTPFCFPLDPERGCAEAVGSPSIPEGSAGLQGFTSKAVLTGRVRGRKYEGTVYTKDQGYITADGFIGQILLVVGGTGDFEGATGRAAIGGQEVGGFASYTGHICVAPQP